MPVGVGVIAVDPTVIPLGTRVFVPGYGAAVAADVGSAIKGAIIDLWMPTPPPRGRGVGAPSRSPSTVSRRDVRLRLALALLFGALVAATASRAPLAATR